MFSRYEHVFQTVSTPVIPRVVTQVVHPVERKSIVTKVVTNPPEIVRTTIRKPVVVRRTVEPYYDSYRYPRHYINHRDHINRQIIVRENKLGSYGGIYDDDLRREIEYLK